MSYKEYKSTKNVALLGTSVALFLFLIAAAAMCGTALAAYLTYGQPSVQFERFSDAFFTAGVNLSALLISATGLTFAYADKDPQNSHECWLVAVWIVLGTILGCLVEQAIYWGRGEFSFLSLLALLGCIAFAVSARAEMLSEKAEASTNLGATPRYFVSSFFKWLRVEPAAGILVFATLFVMITVCCSSLLFLVDKYANKTLGIHPHHVFVAIFLPVPITGVAFCAALFAIAGGRYQRSVIKKTLRKKRPEKSEQYEEPEYRPTTTEEQTQANRAAARGVDIQAELNRESNDE